MATDTLGPSDFLSSLRPMRQGIRIASIRFWLIIFIVGIYTQRSIYWGETLLVPNVISIIAALFLYLRLGQTIPSFLRSHWRLAAFAIAVLLINAVVTARGDLLVHLRSAAQMISSLLQGFVFFWALLTLGPERVRTLFASIFWFLLAVCFFEVLLGGHDLVLLLSQAIHFGEPHEVYSADARDAALWGGVRPIAFASEPSFVGVAIVYLASSSALLAKDPFSLPNIVRSGASILLAFGLVRSSTILAALVIFVLGFYLLRSTRVKFRTVIFRSVALAIAVAAIAYAVWTQFGEGFLSHADDFSSYTRIIFPIGMAYLVLQSSPVWGVGIGGWSALDKMIWDVLVGSSQIGNLMYRSSRETIDSRLLIVNSFWLYWIFLGLGGGTAFGLALWRLLRNAGLRSPTFVFVATALCWNTIGGQVDARTWMYPFLFAAVAIMVKELAAGREPPPSYTTRHNAATTR